MLPKQRTSLPSANSDFNTNTIANVLDLPHIRTRHKINHITQFCRRSFLRFAGRDASINRLVLRFMLVGVVSVALVVVVVVETNVNYHRAV